MSKRHRTAETRRARATRALCFVAALFVLAQGAWGSEVRLQVENDLLAKNPTPDDLYTFSFALEVEKAPFVVTLRENAFTDRAAGIRFDETYLDAGRSLPAALGWSFGGNIGIVHVGRGVFGQSVQNVVHRSIGNELVDLDYVSGSLHPHAGLSAAHPLFATRRLDVEVLADADVVPGLRSLAFLGARARFSTRRGIAFDAMAGGGFAHASSEWLAPHLERAAVTAGIAAVLGDRLIVSWSYNQFGVGREHVSVEYRFDPKPSRPTWAPLARP